MKKRINEIKLNPSLYYREPADVVHDPGLANYERLEILTAWELDARALSVAAEEGMSGAQPSRLQAVVNARLEVEARAAAAGPARNIEPERRHSSSARFVPHR